MSALDRWLSDFMRKYDEKVDRELRRIIRDGYKAGHVPRYLWMRPFPQGPMDLSGSLDVVSTSTTIHYGDTMPEGGPWVVLTVTPEVVALVLGTPEVTS